MAENINPEKLKLCKDCKHYEFHRGPIFGDLHQCNRKRVEFDPNTFDPVLGHKHKSYLVGDWFDCSNERRDCDETKHPLRAILEIIGLLKPKKLDKCGPEGKYWEAR